MVWSAALFQDLRIDASPVVPNPETKLPTIIGDLYFNLATSRVRKCVQNRLATNRISLFDYQRIEIPRSTLYHCLESYLIV